MRDDGSVLPCTVVHPRSLRPAGPLSSSCSCACRECAEVTRELSLPTIAGYVLALVHVGLALVWTLIVLRDARTVPSCPTRASEVWNARRERRSLTAALFAGPLFAWLSAVVVCSLGDLACAALLVDVGPPLLTMPHIATTSTAIIIVYTLWELLRPRRDARLRLPSPLVAALAFCIWSAWLASDYVELRASVAIPVGAAITGWRVQREDPHGDEIDPWLEHRVGRRLQGSEGGDVPAFGISPCDYEQVAVSFVHDGRAERFYGCTKVCGSSMSVQWLAQMGDAEERRCTDAHAFERVLVSLGSPIAMGFTLPRL